MAELVQSRDGTSIAFDRRGSGPPLVVVHGALGGRASMGALADQLARYFEVLTYDRRGRGESEDTPPYAVQREIEDLAAVVVRVGGPADLFGHSSGGVLGIDAVLAGLPIRRLAVYEPPYAGGDEGHRPAADFADRLERLISQGDRDGALRLFLGEGPSLPAGTIDELSRSPKWADWLQVVDTTAYDARLVGRGDFPSRLRDIDILTFVLVGAVSGAWVHAAADALVSRLSRGQVTVLADQSHGAHRTAPEILADILAALLVDAPQQSG